LGVTSFLVLDGIFMPALSPTFLLSVAGAATLYFSCLDCFKVWLFARLELR
jgi:hypothetical protein